MITTAQRCLAFTIASLLPGVAFAFNVGELQARSRAGAPLDAVIDLYAGPGERAAPFEITLERDLFADPGNTLGEVLRSISTSVEHDDAGYSYIRLTSRGPLASERVEFRLRVAQGARAITRRYALQLLPARSASPTAPLRKVTRTVRAPQASTEMPTGTYGPVRSGDSLWTITKRVAPGQDPMAYMRRLHAANPTAFVNGDMNRLKVGVMLQLPGTQVAAGKPAPRPAPAPVAVDSVVSATVDAPRQPEPEPTPREVVTPLVTRDPELMLRLAELDVKYAAIRAQYDPAQQTSTAIADVTASTPVAEVREEPASAAAQMTAVDDREAVAGAPVNAAAAPVEPVAAVPASTTDAARAPEHVAAPAAAARAPVPTVSGDQGITPPERSPAAHPMSVIVGTLLALVLAALIAGGIISYRAREQRQRRNRLVAHASAEAARKAEVTRKAENRIRVESEMRDLLDNRAPTAPVVDAVMDLSSTNTRDVLAAAARLAPGTDVEIDASIAHGRYQDAERLLRDVIANSPRNVTAKLRLAEVYYIMERIPEFSALAQDLFDHHRADMSSEDWQRVVRMGKLVAPELGLFSGPRAVGLRA